MYPVVNFCTEPLDLSFKSTKSSHHVNKSTPKLSSTSDFDQEAVNNMLNNRLITHNVTSKRPLPLSSISSVKSISPAPAHYNNKNNFNWHSDMHTPYSFTEENSVPVICTPDINPSNDSGSSSSESEYSEVGSNCTKMERHINYNPENVESIEQALGRSYYKCNDCRKSYLTAYGLSKHQEFYCRSAACNKNAKSFKCNSCDKVYKSSGSFKLHIQIHTLPHNCDICGRSFSRPWILEGHKRVHTGEKPFKCQNCDRAFADKSNLRVHMQTHANVKKHLCYNCNKSYARKDALRRHKCKKLSPQVN